MNKISGLCVPNFACPVITASNKFISVLVEGAVGQWKHVGLQCLEKLKILFFFFLYFQDKLWIDGTGTFNKTFELAFLALSDYGFFVGDLVNELIDIGSRSGWIYSEERLSKSIDLV